MRSRGAAVYRLAPAEPSANQQVLLLALGRLEPAATTAAIEFSKYGKYS